MKCLRVLGFLFISGSLASVGCAKGRDAKSAGKDEKLGFDEEGKGQRCDAPKSSCEEVKDPSLDFKEHCRVAGFRIKQCGCTNLCTGNVNGDRVGYDQKNRQSPCTNGKEGCEAPETSAAFQDACTDAGGEMLECNCQWMCSKLLKKPLPDAPKDEKPADDDSSTDDKGEKKKEEKPHGNMDGKSPDEVAKEKAQSSKGKKSKSDDSSGSDTSSGSGGKKKKTGRFFDPE
jgi:hypothetical protein